MRKFGRLAEAAVGSVECATELRHGAVDQFAGKIAVAGVADRADVLQLGRDLVGGGERLLAAIFPGVDDGGQDLVEAGHAARAVRRPVGAAIERLQLGREEHAHRPAAAAGEHLHRVHVDLVEVGPLLAIDLDRHEVLVEQRGDRVVLEALVLHHVAPVAGRVADRKKDRLLLAARFFDRLVAPGIPVDRIVLVLEQDRGSFRGRGDWAWETCTM